MNRSISKWLLIIRQLRSRFFKNSNCWSTFSYKTSIGQKWIQSNPWNSHENETKNAMFSYGNFQNSGYICPCIRMACMSDQWRWICAKRTAGIMTPCSRRVERKIVIINGTQKSDDYLFFYVRLNFLPFDIWLSETVILRCFKGIE